MGFPPSPGGGTASGVSSPTGITIESGTGLVSGDTIFKTDGTEAARFLFGAAGPPNTQGTLLFNHGDALDGSGQSVLTGRWIDIRQGTAASPDAGLVPPIKISRTLSNLAGNIINDGSEQLSGISVTVEADAASTVQPVGLYANAHNAGTSAATADACGIYGVADITAASGTGTAIPLFLLAIKNQSTQTMTAAQITADNRSGVGSSYSPTVAGDCLISLFNDPGGSQIGGGIVFSASTAKLDVGIGFNQGSYLNSATIRDDSSSPTSIVVNGSHGRGLDMTGATFSGSAIAIPNNVSIVAENAAGNAARNLIKIDSSDQTNIGDAAGGQIIFLNNVNIVAKNIVTDTTTGTRIGTATNQKFAFWNKIPIVQPTTSISGATRVGGGGTTVTTTDTYGGYTLAQLAAVIINTGLTA